MNEKLLLPLIVEGDERAFTQLFKGHYNQLSEFVFSITRSVPLTEEIVHDVFLKIWRDREKLIAVEKFTSYLFIVTRNYTLNAIRKVNSQQQKTLVYDDKLVLETDVCEALADINYHELLDNAIADLPPQQQTVFLLKGQGLKNAEIATRMAISPNSVKKYQQWSMQSIERFIRAKLALKSLLIFFCLFF